MQVVEVLSVNEQVQHVVALPAHLQSDLHPVQLSGLEELGGLEGAEEIPAKEEPQTTSVKFKSIGCNSTPKVW